jgi:uncharacterized protein YaiL (DUF2058 family)
VHIRRIAAAVTVAEQVAAAEYASSEHQQKNRRTHRKYDIS